MFFLKRTVVETDLSNILSGFHRILADLDAHIKHHGDSSDNKRGLARSLTQQANEHDVAVATASNVRSKIADLVS